MKSEASFTKLRHLRYNLADKREGGGGINRCNINPVFDKLVEKKFTESNNPNEHVNKLNHYLHNTVL